MSLVKKKKQQSVNMLVNYIKIVLKKKKQKNHAREPCKNLSKKF